MDKKKRLMDSKKDTGNLEHFKNYKMVLNK